MQLATEKQSLNQTLIQGILGVQGTGKTTLCQVLTLILGKLGYSTVSLSLDDLYKTYVDRQNLQKAWSTTSNMIRMERDNPAVVDMESDHNL